MGYFRKKNGTRRTAITQQSKIGKNYSEIINLLIVSAGSLFGVLVGVYITLKSNHVKAVQISLYGFDEPTQQQVYLVKIL